MPKNAFRQAAVIATLAVGVVIVGTYLMTIMEPDIPLADLLFEITRCLWNRRTVNGNHTGFM